MLKTVANSCFTHVFRNVLNAANQIRSGPRCAGKHRGLGVHLSFVRSITLDVWSDRQLSLIEAGGNRKAAEWFERYGISKLDLREKYNSMAAESYRSKLKCIVDGKSFTDPVVTNMNQTPQNHTSRPTVVSSKKFIPEYSFINNSQTPTVACNYEEDAFNKHNCYDERQPQSYQHMPRHNISNNRVHKHDIANTIYDGWNAFSSGIKKLAATTAESVGSNWNKYNYYSKTPDTTRSTFQSPHRKANDRICSNQQLPKNSEIPESNTYQIPNHDSTKPTGANLSDNVLDMSYDRNEKQFYNYPFVNNQDFPKSNNYRSNSLPHRGQVSSASDGIRENVFENNMSEHENCYSNQYKVVQFPSWRN